jgi:hypothetical protein
MWNPSKLAEFSRFLLRRENRNSLIHRRTSIFPAGRQDFASRLPLFKSKPYRRTRYIVSRRTLFATPLDVKTPLRWTSPLDVKPGEITVCQIQRGGQKHWSSGGAQVRWRRDGKKLFYIALDGRLMDSINRARRNATFDFPDLIRSL